MSGSHIKSRLRHINIGDMRSAAAQGVTGKGSGVAKAIQHIGVFCIAAGGKAVFALVQVKASFVSGVQIYPDRHAVFFNIHGLWYVTP